MDLTPTFGMDLQAIKLHNLAWAIKALCVSLLHWADLEGMLILGIMVLKRSGNDNYY
jgi:hypothetical protein